MIRIRDRAQSKARVHSSADPGRALAAESAEADQQAFEAEAETARWRADRRRRGWSAVHDMARIQFRSRANRDE